MNRDPCTSLSPACTCKPLGRSFSSASGPTVSVLGDGARDSHYYKPRKSPAQKPEKNRWTGISPRIVPPRRTELFPPAPPHSVIHHAG